MTNEYAETEKTIRKLVPRLMVLTRGCVVETGMANEEWPRRTGAFVFICEDRDGQKVFTQSDHEGRVFIYGDRDIEEYEIIGHDIDLEAVLEALEVLFEEIPWMEGGSTDDYLRTYFKRILDLWEYGKPFHLQSREVKEFIKNILIPKE